MYEDTGLFKCPISSVRALFISIIMLILLIYLYNHPTHSQQGSEMQIFTSHWRAQIDEERYARIGISRGVPRWQSGFRRYGKLNPGSWYKSITDEREWAGRYQREILSPLDPATVVEELQALSDGRDAVLLCWEGSSPGEDWCHRGLVSAWMGDTLGIEVCELESEQEGSGWHHPKLPPSLRQLRRGSK